MSVTIVDKRAVSRDRTSENRARFLRRIKQTIKDQLPDLINGRSLKDMDKTGGDIRVKRKTITEPQIWHTDGGNVDRVLPGNEEYVDGDMIDKPRGGQGKGRGKKASQDGESEDDFIINITRDEFLDFFFEDLELPDMMKTQLSKVKEYKRENAGFQPDGSPNRLSVVKSYLKSFGRRLALRGSMKEELEAVEAELFELEREAEIRADQIPVILLARPHQDLDDGALWLLIAEKNKEIAAIKERMDGVALFEEVDLRYRTVVKREIPSTHATMIMIMDNSGSMGEKEKTIARKFFWLLYSFLRRAYDQVDMRFISHTMTAREMDEEEFFNTKESGGTIVSTALDLCANIIQKDLLNKTNIYIAQVSDGDNWDSDNGTCSEILEMDILPHARYYAYVQVDDYHNEDSGGITTFGSLMNIRGLWKTYDSVSSRNSKLQAKRVYSEKDIYPVFRELFKKKD